MSCTTVLPLLCDVPGKQSGIIQDTDTALVYSVAQYVPTYLGIPGESLADSACVPGGPCVTENGIYLIIVDGVYRNATYNCT